MKPNATKRMFVLIGLFMLLLIVPWVVYAKTAPVPPRLLLAGQAGTAVLEFNGGSGARTAVFLPAPIPGMVVVCSGSDEWAVEADVSCQPLGDSTIGVTAVMPYTITHELTVYWIAVEGSR